MPTISSLLKKYQEKIERLDLELIIARAIGKSREFVLAHPEYKLIKSEKLKVESYLLRRIKHEPLAYIFGEKEFFGLKYKINKDVLIPRPETEMIVEKVISNLKSKISNRKNKKTIICDVGTGSGNIIISLAKFIPKSKLPITNYQLLAADISKKSIEIAKHNAKLNKVDKKIKFLRGNLLNPIKKILNPESEFLNLIITANLPYLSPKIYSSCSPDIKKYEPKSALISQKEGLKHYEELLKQLAPCHWSPVTCFLEISPEQKTKISRLIKKYFQEPKIIFHKDLSGRWRICQLEILNYKF